MSILYLFMSLIVTIIATALAAVLAIIPISIVYFLYRELDGQGEPAPSNDPWFTLHFVGMMNNVLALLVLLAMILGIIIYATGLVEIRVSPEVFA